MGTSVPRRKFPSGAIGSGILTVNGPTPQHISHRTDRVTDWPRAPGGAFRHPPGGLHASAQFRKDRRHHLFLGLGWTVVAHAASGMPAPACMSPSSSSASSAWGRFIARGRPMRSA
jgi:hypothetical protein